MREQLKIIKNFLTYKEEFFHKKDMGYSMSQEEYDKYYKLRDEALIAKMQVERESKYIKKLLKKVK
jgi:hypothetical protein